MTSKNMNKQSAQSKSKQTAQSKSAQSKQTETKVSEKVLNCETIKKALALSECVQFETAKTAKNSTNSASVLYQDFFALVLVSDETRASKRFLEYWGKKNNNCELLLTKQVFSQLSELTESKDSAILKTFFEAAALHKSHKMIFKLSNDDAFLLAQTIIDNL